MSIWENFDDIVSVDELEEAKAQFEPVEAGQYNAILEEMKADVTQTGQPKLAGRFRLVDNGKIVFYNQVLYNANYPQMNAVNVANALHMISALKGEDIEYTKLSDIATEAESLIMGVEYTIEVSYATKDIEKKYARIKIIEEPTSLEDIEVSDGTGEDVPF